jgi:hypothetical protein
MESQRDYMTYPKLFSYQINGRADAQPLVSGRAYFSSRSSGFYISTITSVFSSSIWALDPDECASLKARPTPLFCLGPAHCLAQGKISGKQIPVHFHQTSRK